MTQPIILTGTNKYDATRVQTSGGTIYKAQPDPGNNCKGCAFTFATQDCYNVPVYCSSRRSDGQSVIWIKESS